MRKRCCVKCGGDLRPQKVGEVEVDHCPACGGLWLDRRELQELAAMPESAVAALQELQQRGAKKGAAPCDTTERSRLNAPCPACDGKLTLAVVGGIKLEICSACGGVFLDAGELEKATAEVISRDGFQLASIVALARSVSTHGTIGD